MSVRMRGPGRWVTVHHQHHPIIQHTISEFLLDQRDSAGAGWSPTQIVELRSMRPGHTRAVTCGGKTIIII